MLHDQRGAILIFIVLIIGGIGLSIASVLSRSSLSNFLSVNNERQAAQTRAAVFGCLDEALIHIQKDPNFSPATVSIGDAICSLSVANNGPSGKTITLSLTEGAITRTVQAAIETSPFSVTQVIEP